MNVILIPFFLAANVIDKSEWTFGPEYTYSVNMNSTVKFKKLYPDSAMHHHISTIKCRPKTSDSLFCHLYNTTGTVYVQEESESRLMITEQIFEINFNQRGVESVLMDTFSVKSSNYDTLISALIKNFAEQLSIGTDMRQRIRMSQFTEREATTKGNCTTMYKITRSRTGVVEKEDAGFQLVVSPMIDAQPDTDLTIEKHRTDCFKRQIEYETGAFKVLHFFSKMQISETSRFEMFTEFDVKINGSAIEGEILPPNMISFKVLLHVKLDDIKPAQEEIPSIPQGELSYLWDSDITNVIN